LVLDCHQQPRKLEVTFAGGVPADLLTYLRPFARPQVVAPGQLAMLDRDDHFRIYVVPNRMHVILRKAAGPRVIAELIAQLARVDAGEPCGDCVARCTARALSWRDRRLVIDDELCTACLDCVTHHVEPAHFSPSLEEKEH
jgi:ferredoxin